VRDSVEGTRRRSARSNGIYGRQEEHSSDCLDIEVGKIYEIGLQIAGSADRASVRQPFVMPFRS
jgi:hypothetical protein